MAIVKKYLTVNELEPGMIIAEEITLNKLVLISAGSILTEDMISKLREKYFHSRVTIFTDENEELEINRIKTVEEIEKSFKEFSSNIEKIFTQLEGNSKTDIDDIRAFAKKIQYELISPSAGIKNIVFYGNGGDEIFRHTVNVTALCYILGKWIGLNEKDLNLLTYSAVLHDYGKVKIDRNILKKKEGLTKEEEKQIVIHPISGYKMLNKISYLSNSVSAGVLMHHERLDGSGYPQGLKEDKIHFFAKIIAIADTFDLVNSNRERNPFEAIETIKAESLNKLDYGYSKIFIDHLVNYYIGESVKLNTEKICKIIQVDTNDLSRPLILDDMEFIDLKKQKDMWIEALVF